MDPTLRLQSVLRYSASFIALLIAYTALACVGLIWAEVRGAGSPIWPAAGVGLAGLMLGGVRLWPAILVGRLLAAALTGSAQPLWADAAIAAGNALATAMAVMTFSSKSIWDEALMSLRGLVRFCLAGASVQALLSALIGCAVLFLSAGLAWWSLLDLYIHWSIGVFVGAVTTAPLIFAWYKDRSEFTLRALAGFVAVMLVTGAFAWLVFASPTHDNLRTWHILPLLIVATLTFGARGATTAIAIIAAIAVFGTNQGIGQFNQMVDIPAQRLMLLQQFIGTIALTGLILAVVTEERRTKDVLAAQQEYLRRAEQESRARAKELEVILGAVPASVVIAHDRECREMSVNNFGAEVLRRIKWTDSIASLNPKVRMLDVTGRELEEDERPMRRAARGEIISNFEGKFVFENGQCRDFLGAARPLYDVEGSVRGAVGAFLDMTERKKAEERITLLAREVDHRAKNIMAVVQAMVRLTKAEDMASFRAAITGRIANLARTHNLLAANRWDGISLTALVRDEFAAHGLSHGGNPAQSHLHTSGPDLTLPPTLAQSLALVIHELITNAIKYGALSVPQGRVRLEWTIEARPAGRMLHVNWAERGGPEVRPPERAGFGSDLIVGAIQHQLDGMVELDWQACGLRVALAIPLSEQVPKH